MSVEQRVIQQMQTDKIRYDFRKCSVDTAFYLALCLVSDRMSKVAAAPRRAAVHTKFRHRGCSPMPRPDSRQTARGSHNVEGWTPPLLPMGNILPISHNDRENPPFVWLSSVCLLVRSASLILLRSPLSRWSSFTYHFLTPSNVLVSGD